MNDKLRCIVIDDEPIGRELIVDFVKSVPFLEVTEYLASPNFVRKYDKRNKNLTTLSSVVFCYFCEVKF